MKRYVVRVSAALAATLLLFVLYLWMSAGWDFAYMVRVLWHQDSGTDDYRWKRSAVFAASSAACVNACCAAVTSACLATSTACEAATFATWSL